MTNFDENDNIFDASDMDRDEVIPAEEPELTAAEPVSEPAAEPVREPQYAPPQGGYNPYGYAPPQGGYAPPPPQYGYSAPYTPPQYAPPRSNASPYAQNPYAQNPYAQPAAPYGERHTAQRSEKPTRKKRRIGVRIIAAVLALAIIGGAAAFFFTEYVIVTGNNGTLFSVVDRDSLSVPSTNVPQPSVDTPTAPPSPVNPNGPTLQINGTPDERPSAEPAAKAEGELTITQIAEKCTPAVVGITASTESQYYGLVSSVGTGIIMTADGYIITNCHVINGATYIVVTLHDETTHEATLVGSDERSDLAVLKIDATGLNLTPAEFGDSDALRVGELVVAIGNPLGLDFMGTVTDGIVSAINRNVVVDERTMTLIQTNAAINSGNSGGPLINKYGQVIGINTLKMQDYSTTVEGLGFAIPTNTAKEIIDELIAYGYVKGRPAIGIEGRNVDSYTRQRYNIPYGVIVTAIHTQSHAFDAGLRPADIITAFNGELVYTVDEINIAKEAFKAGDTITITYYREGFYYDISFALDDEAVLDQAAQNYTQER